VIRVSDNERAHHAGARQRSYEQRFQAGVEPLLVNRLDLHLVVLPLDQADVGAEALNPGKPQAPTTAQLSTQELRGSATSNRVRHTSNCPENFLSHASMTPRSSRAVATWWEGEVPSY